MSKRWHTNKTQPNVAQHFLEDIIIIWKDRSICISGISINDFNELYLDAESYGNPLWKNARENIVKWAYIKDYFKKELDEIERGENDGDDIF